MYLFLLTWTRLTGPARPNVAEINNNVNVCSFLVSPQATIPTQLLSNDSEVIDRRARRRHVGQLGLVDRQVAGVA